jgi:phosphatidylglycerophosphate synthase
MLDAPLRRLIDPPLAGLASLVNALGIEANAITVAGFAVGVAALPLIATRHYAAGLVLMLLNRLLDGLDGAVARLAGETDLGAYLDIVLDFLFYASVPLAFALADPSRALAAAFLIVSFVGTGTTFLAFAIFAAKRGYSTEEQGRKSFYYLGGLTEGSETILAFALAALLPDWFSVIAYVFGTMYFLTTGTRVAAAVEALRKR